MNKNNLNYDIFGFANLINIDHLTDEQILELEKIFDDYE
jgi:hypothetical protein